MVYDAESKEHVINLPEKGYLSRGKPGDVLVKQVFCRAGSKGLHEYFNPPGETILIEKPVPTKIPDGLFCLIRQSATATFSRTSGNRQFCIDSWRALMIYSPVHEEHG